MDKRDAVLRRYLREVKGWLPCGGKMKKELLGKIGGTVSGYLEENPEGDYAALVCRFGTPQQIASAYVDEIETPELLHSLRIRRRIVKIVSGTALVVVILWVGVVAASFAYNVINDNGYYVDEITEGTIVPLNEEDNVETYH